MSHQLIVLDLRTNSAWQQTVQTFHVTNPEMNLKESWTSTSWQPTVCGVRFVLSLRSEAVPLHVLAKEETERMINKINKT
jgi:hypothetical protein